MELMWLVYAVENLTYKGDLIFVLSSILLSIAAILWVAGIILPKQDFWGSKDTKLKVEEGSYITLTSDYEDLTGGVDYMVRFLCADDIRFENAGDRFKSYSFTAISKRIQHPTVKTLTRGITLPSPKIFVVLSIIAVMLHVVLPTRDTAIKMAGAYLLQSVVTNDKTKELGDAAYRATLRQLTKWSEEVPELADMLIDAGKEKLENEIKAN